MIAYTEAELADLHLPEDGCLWVTRKRGVIRLVAWAEPYSATPLLLNRRTMKMIRIFRAPCTAPTTTPHTGE